MATVLITGASGVLGRAIHSAYELRGDEVHVAQRGAEPSECSHRLDVTDLAQVTAVVDRVAPDVVLHLASESVVAHAAEHKAATYAINIDGTLNVLQALFGSSCVLLAASSERAYAPGSDGPISEDHPLTRNGTYGVSKAEADVAVRESGLTASVVRSSNVFGPGDGHRSRLVPSVLHAIVDQVPLRMRTDGHPKRDFVYSADVAEAFLALTDGLLEGRPGVVGKAFNVGTGRGLAVRDLAERAARIAGVRLDIEYVDGAADDIGEDRVLDCARIASEVGWRPRTSLDEGLALTIAWARASLTAA